MIQKFKYILRDADEHQLARITLPFLMNIGTQFEDPHSRGTFEVHRIVKEKDESMVHPIHIKIYCRQINATPFLLDHLDKTEYFTMTKNLPL